MADAPPPPTPESTQTTLHEGTAPQAAVTPQGLAQDAAFKEVPTFVPLEAPGALEALNTPQIGYSGVLLVAASYVVPAIAPDLDSWLASHGLPAYAVHAGVALVGAACALLGRWRRFEC